MGDAKNQKTKGEGWTMKKQILFLMAMFILVAPVGTKSVQAFFGGGISGPLPVYNLDKTVDAATIATQINTAHQLEAALSNLAKMDPATAAANMGQIQQTLAQLQVLQQEVTGMTMDYQNFQYQWDNTYQDFRAYNGMSGTDYAYQAQQLNQATQQQIYDAMRAQGLISGIPGDAANLQHLMNASQSSQGALAAAQAGNQISGLMAQQMMRLQQMMSQSNQAQLAYYEQKQHQDAAAEAAAANAYNSEVNLGKSGGHGTLR